MTILCRNRGGFLRTSLFCGCLKTGLGLYVFLLNVCKKPPIFLCENHRKISCGYDAFELIVGMDVLNKNLEQRVNMFPGIFEASDLKIRKIPPNVVCISEILIPTGNSCYMKTLLPLSKECNNVDGAVNLTGSHGMINDIKKSHSEILLVFPPGKTVGDVFGRQCTFNIPFMGEQLFYIGGDPTQLYMPSKSMYDFKVLETRVLFDIGDDDCMSFSRDIIVDNICGTIKCLKHDSIPPMVHTIHGTIRWNYDRNSIIFQGVKKVDYIIDYVLNTYCKVYNEESIHVSMAVLGAWVGKSYLSVANKSSMLEKSMSHILGTECVHFYTRTETGGGIAKFRIKCWDRLSQNNGIDLQISQVNMVKNHICTISSSGFAMIHFFWPEPVTWCEALKKDTMRASNLLVEIIRSCS